MSEPPTPSPSPSQPNTPGEPLGYVEETVTLHHDSKNFITGILTTPANVNKERPGKVVVVAHGLGGHKDYCYQKLLCRVLAEKLGLYSFRFDFRNCGDSSDITPPGVTSTEGKNTQPRVIEADLQDFDLVIFDYLLGQKKLILLGLICHSRGGVAGFRWALTRQHRVPIPNFINCSARYVGHELKSRVDTIYPNAATEGGYYLKAYRHGAYPNVWIPYEETIKVSGTDLSDLPNLDPNTSVLSVYGLRDDVVSLEDVGKFANDLRQRHTLELLQHADHNFYGLPTPETAPKKANYNPAVVDIITKWLSSDSLRERFMEINKYSGVVPRWKDVEGVANFRDFGGYKSSKFPSQSVRSGLLFRSANLSLATEKGKSVMTNELGIKTIFDLRSESERERMGAASIPGAEVRWVPVFQKQDSSPEEIARRYQHFFDPMTGFEQAYKEILTKAGPSYRQIMLHLRDRPNDPIVIHCTAGKDRTGVICALILLFMDIDSNTIAREYELTTHGLREEIPRIISAIDGQKGHWEDPEKMLNMLSSKYDAMIGSINMIARDFGGVISYFKKYCDLTDDDLAKIKQNLTNNSGQGWKWHSVL
ncbi:hypothetical protein AWJ20_2616 [Sugiyamaella lignohabitans]|uniref:Tyrosine specific protein phosphatases domain-containing protein n=1 Tax=Sugiyamaella lignohabitans TaxID=796027 RepID=A0A161HMJ5_9ASCO|nr:uncharacterized protein AWJ20_2616 [Sugiyamaella lignohabitans]ANB14997.1 hypothetical protein AWJ20_2616 [Sugiyamaella lignohabitans]